MSRAASLGTNLDLYISEINKYSLLSREQEVALATRYRKHEDRGLAEEGQAHDAAAQELVVANLRFVVKVAHEYRGYGLKLLDLVQEGNIGLIMAVKKFDARKGYRLISYAVWWIRAYIQNFIMRSWSLVKLGTTQAQRKLFFRLRSERERADRELGRHELVSAKELAARLGVAEGEVSDMDGRLAARDFSLDLELQEGSRQTHLDRLSAGGMLPEERVAASEERSIIRGKVQKAMVSLNEKERYIVEHRLMAEEPKTLQQIGQRFCISRERARQIEGVVIRKIRDTLSGSGLALAAA